MGKSKPYQVALEEDLAAEVLNTPLPELPEVVAPPPARTIGEKLEQARDALQDAVHLANDILASQMMTDILAQALAKDHKRRGVPRILVQDDGSVVLQVSYDGRAPLPKVERPSPLKRKKWSSDLPSLPELRAEAAELGVDISDLGRQKKAILDRLEAHRLESSKTDAASA